MIEREPESELDDFMHMACRGILVLGRDFMMVCFPTVGVL